MAEGSSSGRDVKAAILEAAESIFADFGYHGTTTRAIAEAAHVNLALIHYHFGSKEQLHDKILFNQAIPLNRARLRRLDAVLAETKTPTLRAVLEALLQANLEYVVANPRSARNYARIADRIAYGVDQRSRRLMSELFDEVAEKYIAAIQLSLPGMSRQDAVWAYALLVIAGKQLFEKSSRVAFEKEDWAPQEVYDRILAFALAGIRGLGAVA